MKEFANFSLDYITPKTIFFPKFSSESTEQKRLFIAFAHSYNPTSPLSFALSCRRFL